VTPEMQFKCLLLCSDEGAFSILQRVLGELFITVDHCLDCATARLSLNDGSHDLAILDDEGPETSELAYHIQDKNKKITVIAIAEYGHPTAWAHFTIPKPLNIGSAIECLSSAYSRMLRDFRVNARHALLQRVFVTGHSGREFFAMISDIGENGFGMKTSEVLQVGEILSVAVSLPGVQSPLEIKARVIWSRDYGIAGCEIVTMPSADRNALRDWIKNQIRATKSSELCTF
jgi:hypothetical protein